MNRASQIRFVARQFIALRKTVQHKEALVLMIMNEGEVYLFLKEPHLGCTLLGAQQDNRPVLQIIWTKVAGVTQLYAVERSPGNLVELRHNIEVHNRGVSPGSDHLCDLQCCFGRRSGMVPIVATEVFGQIERLPR
jgi:hypothetical protein